MLFCICVIVGHIPSIFTAQTVISFINDTLLLEKGGFFTVLTLHTECYDRSKLYESHRCFILFHLKSNNLHMNLAHLVLQSVALLLSTGGILIRVSSVVYNIYQNKGKKHLEFAIYFIMNFINALKGHI